MELQLQCWAVCCLFLRSGLNDVKSNDDDGGGLRIYGRKQLEALRWRATWGSQLHDEGWMLFLSSVPTFVFLKCATLLYLLSVPPFCIY